MAVSLKHAFNCTLPDDPDTTVVRPSNWNAEHELVAADGAFLVGTGTGVEEQDAATARSTMGAAADGSTNDTTVLQYTLDALATYPAINYATPAGA